MTALYRFLDVRYEGAERAYTFTLHSGESRLLQLADKTEKAAIIDWAIGESICAQGRIEIMQGERRFIQAGAPGKREERRNRNEPIPLIWRSLQESRLGRVGWVAANGGLISNLKIWENVTLPLWYHTKRDVAETEQSVEFWLIKLGLESSAFADFMAALPYSVEPWQRKLAGLLRALVQMPRVLIVDAGVFEDVKARMAQSWISALDVYARQGRAVLVLTDKATVLPWGKIE
jgi:ABC-type polar amino acid transport system ATPase subunit